MSFLPPPPRIAMLAAMASGLPWIFVHGATVLLGLALQGGCRVAPAEAPPPDAAAWPGQAAERRAGLEEEAPPATTSASLRPRPARAIFRDELERATGPGPAYLLRQLGPEPFRHDGHFIGWEITELFPDDPELCAPGCDLALGDVVLAVNGHRLHTPQDLSNALQALPGWTQLHVQSLRDGQRRDVTYTVIDDPS